MCEFDRVLGRFQQDKPSIAWKVFRKLTDKKAEFAIAPGSVARGQWFRFDKVDPTPRNKRGCFIYEDGFHAFTSQVSIDDEAHDHYGDIVIPVLLKGRVTHALQNGVNIIVGEYMYVPTAEELSTRAYAR